jgi:hypothetical protein
VIEGDESFKGWSDEFHFFGYHPELSDFGNGSKVKICYHQESRGADSDASETIYYWVIDSIKIR